MVLPYECKYRNQARRALVAYSTVSMSLGMLIGVTLCLCVNHHYEPDQGKLSHGQPIATCLNTSSAS